MKKKTKTILILAFLILFISNSTAGQNANDSDFFHQKRFNAGILVGLNSSELAGRGLDSYLGWNIGILGIASINNRLHLSTELLLSQNGEYLQEEFFPDVDYSTLRLNFIEIPVQVNFQLQQNKEWSDRKGWIRTGVAFAHLLDFKAIANEENFEEVIKWKNENALLVNFGGAFFLNQHWAIDFKMSLPVNADDLIPTLSFRGLYLL